MFTLCRDDTLEKYLPRAGNLWFQPATNVWNLIEEQTIMIQAIYKGLEIEMEMHQQAQEYWKCDYTLLKHPKRTETLHQAARRLSSVEGGTKGP
jgi:hypothetical protein